MTTDSVSASPHYFAVQNRQSEQFGSDPGAVT